MVHNMLMQLIDMYSGSLSLIFSRKKTCKVSAFIH